MINLGGIELPSGLLWADEFETNAVAQSTRRALDGSLIIFYGQRRSGLPITLQSESDAGWFTRSQIEAIALQASSPGGQYPLHLRGHTWTVMFRHHEEPAFEAKPLINLANPQPGDFYLATLKLMTI